MNSLSYDSHKKEKVEYFLIAFTHDSNSSDNETEKNNQNEIKNVEEEKINFDNFYKEVIINGGIK